MGLVHFTEDEFIMGGEHVFSKMNDIFLSRIDELRSNYGKPIKINSSYRSPAYNKSIGGSIGSKHMQGIAIDISCINSTDRAKLVWAALDLGLTVGVGATFVHIDGRPEQIMFTY